jgi:tetratricopeptide (TPR) repeat protein/predicted Ser/Thr protein kinase
MGRLSACLDQESIVAFSEGRFEANEIARIDDHIAGCADCRRLVAAALALRTGGRATGTAEGSSAGLHLEGDHGLRRGTVVGRYTVLELAGRGGMGEVYAAYDAELDRKIAFKVLRQHGRQTDGRDRERLLREARALAKLSHPNVVAVHDLGTFEGRVFVAMEFVDGVTLKDWLSEHPRTRDEILDVFVAAARGLAAAHAAGLVHRDFKPGNVMIARDGAVRVLDFGLARHLDETNAAMGTASVAGELHPTALPAKTTTTTLTATGELLGTPRYMAPEQMRVEPTDARTDQFSFCVALYEALYGEPPFAGATLKLLMPEVLAGRVRPPPQRSSVPPWLRRILLRGLSVSPDARWRSMTDLAAKLVNAPARARRRWVIAAGGLALAGLVAGTLTRSTPHAASLCRGGPARLAGVWEPVGDRARPRRETVRRRFLASGAPMAQVAWERTSRLLDRYAADWLALYANTCEATHMRGVQSARDLDLRMGCLDERRLGLAALTDVLVAADSNVVAKAVSAASALPLLERCADVVQLGAPVAPPRDRATGARVDDVRKRAAAAKALDDTGRHDDALKRIKVLIEEARTMGYPPLLAELLTSRTAFQNGANYKPEVAAIGEEAVMVAVASGRDALAARAASELVAIFGYYQARPAEGWRWSRMARALFDRAGSKDAFEYAKLLHNEAIVEFLENRPRSALDRLNESVALMKKALGPEHPQVALNLDDIAMAWHQLGNDAEALSISSEALRILSKAYGSATTEICLTQANRGEYMVGLHRADESLPVLEDATRCWESQVGPEHPFVAYPLTAWGRALLEKRTPQPAEAARILERALRIREAREPDKTLIAETRDALAKARATVRALRAGP